MNRHADVLRVLCALRRLTFVVLPVIPACASVLGADFDRPAATDVVESGSPTSLEPTPGPAPKPTATPTPTSDASDCAAACASPPASSCIDATTFRTYLPRGQCAQSLCSYAYYDVLCAHGCERGACLGEEPCTGIACVTPPAPACADESTLLTHSASGTCSGGTCSYARTETACARGCTSGACTGDPCAGISCTHPPGPSCLSASTRRGYEPSGTCSGGACSYAPVDTPCPNGCKAGECLGDPCAGIACTLPPAAACLNTTTRRSYSPTGTCGGGACAYAPIDTNCAHGCEAGACLVDPCVGVTCESPHAASCVSATKQRSYAPIGTCHDGACLYGATDTVCTAPANADPTCTSGACTFTCRPRYVRSGASCVEETRPFVLDDSNTIIPGQHISYQTPELPAGRYEVSLSGTSGDADLYVSAGAAPTTSRYDCRPYRWDANELCTVTLTAPAKIYAKIVGAGDGRTAYRLTIK